MTTASSNAAFGRRSLLRRMLLAAVVFGAGAGLGTVAANSQERTYAMQVYRDPNCGCCHVWTELMAQSGRFRTTLNNDANMSAVKRRLGVPMELASCHTAIVQGYVIEGHVPADAILRLVVSGARDIRGLAVPGMPRGSPGMEQPDGTRDAFDVIAIHYDGSRSIFARYPATTQ